MIKPIKLRQISVVLLLFTTILAPLATQELSLDATKALEEWRWGVISLNDGLPGKSLLSMERAVSLNPTDPVIREWLGRAYWRSGVEDAALATWDSLADEDNTSTVLMNRAEQLRRRLTGEEEIPVDDEWIPLVSFKGVDGGIGYFERPSVARSPGDGSGSLLVSSYAGGDIIRIDANGTLVERYEGGVEGFDRPFDILPTQDGRILVSEFQGDRISVLSLEKHERGYRTESWGSTGRNVGEFLGPQYMALSPDGAYVYISDWGNRRVAKWSLDGRHVLNLEAGGLFQGFEGPSGVACDGERVFVADSLRQTIDVFDPSGNYLGSLVDEGLNAPEGLSIYEGDLLVADGGTIRRIDLVSGEVSIETDLGSGIHRITTVFPDENGNLAVADFDADRIVLLTPLSTLYGGLEVTIDRVRADAYPEMVAELTVKDRRGQPVSGLDSTNFKVFDSEIPLGSPLMDWSSSEDDSLAVVALTDLSGNINDISILINGLDDLAGALESGDTLSLVGAGTNATVHDVVPGEGREAYRNLVGNPIGNRPVLWDEALRLAATRIVPARERKAIVAFVSTAPVPSAFDRYGLVETARLMANNGIVFYPVYANEEARSRELDYIAEQTGGYSSDIFRPEGTGIIARELRVRSIGRYTITWKTPRSSGFGREFIPVSVEVIYINKSGRDESGSFAPLN